MFILTKVMFNEILILVDLIVIGVVELLIVVNTWIDEGKGWVDEGRAMLLLLKIDRVDFVAM